MRSLFRPSRRDALRVGVALGSVAALAIIALLVFGSGSSPRPPARASSAPAPAVAPVRKATARRASSAGLISIFEAPLQLATAPGPTLDRLRGLGVEYVRVIVRWSTLAPSSSSSAQPPGFNASSPSSYPAAQWEAYDAIVRDAAARGMKVMLDIGGPAPQWATGAGAPAGGVPGVWKPSASRFGAFVHAVTARYSGRYTPAGATSPLPRVSFWSIWNEPNLGVNLAPEATDNSTVESSPVMYRGLADAAWGALHATGHGGDLILIGELAPYGQAVGNNVPGNFGYMVPLRFLRGLYCVDSSLHPLQGAAAAARGCPRTAAGSKRFAADHPALFQATGYAVHPYPQGSVAPDVVLRTASPDFAYLAVLGNLERLLDTVTAGYGAGTRFPLYSTEYGYFTNPPYQAGAPLGLAATYLNWAEYISWRSLRIRSWDQYLLVDPPTGGPSKFVTGLEFDTGVQKPTYAAYRMPIFLPATHAAHGQALEVWGCVRPAHYAQVPQHVQIELQPAAGGAYKTVDTVAISDPNGYFDTRVAFPSGGTVRLAWSYPQGPTIYSRPVPITTA